GFEVVQARRTDSIRHAAERRVDGVVKGWLSDRWPVQIGIVVWAIRENTLAIAGVEEDEHPLCGGASFRDQRAEVEHLLTGIDRLGGEPVPACVVELDVESLQMLLRRSVALVDELDEVHISGLGECRREKRRQAT